MSSENTITGVDGEHSVGGTQVARLSGWNLSKSLANTNEWGDSDSEGWTNRSAGRRDATFTSNGKYDTTDEVFDLFSEGDNAASILYMDATKFWQLPRSLCMGFNIAVNVDTQEVIGWDSSWGADGRVYRPGESP